MEHILKINRRTVLNKREIMDYKRTVLKSPQDIRINHINTVNILISPGDLFAWRLIRGWGLICMEKDLHGAY